MRLTKMKDYNKLLLLSVWSCTLVFSDSVLSVSGAEFRRGWNFNPRGSDLYSNNGKFARVAPNYQNENSQRGFLAQSEILFPANIFPPYQQRSANPNNDQLNYQRQSNVPLYNVPQTAQRRISSPQPYQNQITQSNVLPPLKNPRYPDNKSNPVRINHFSSPGVGIIGNVAENKDSTIRSAVQNEYFRPQTYQSPFLQQKIENQNAFYSNPLIQKQYVLTPTNFNPYPAYNNQPLKNSNSKPIFVAESSDDVEKATIKEPVFFVTEGYRNVLLQGPNKKKKYKKPGFIKKGEGNWVVKKPTNNNDVFNEDKPFKKRKVTKVYRIQDSEDGDVGRSEVENYLPQVIQKPRRYFERPPRTKEEENRHNAPFTHPKLKNYRDDELYEPKEDKDEFKEDDESERDDDNHKISEEEENEDRKDENDDKEESESQTDAKPEVDDTENDDDNEENQEQNDDDGAAVPFSEHADPKDIPTKPIYPGEGLWAKKGLKHRPHISPHRVLELGEDEAQPDGYEVFEDLSKSFDNQKTKFDTNVVKQSSLPNEPINYSDNIKKPNTPKAVNPLVVFDPFADQANKNHPILLEESQSTKSSKAKIPNIFDALENPNKFNVAQPLPESKVNKNVGVDTYHTLGDTKKERKTSPETPDNSEKEDITESDDDDESSDDEDKFVPLRLYSQVRNHENEEHLPGDSSDPESGRLKEVIKDSKIHTIYSEEGYEDAAYDHAGHEKKAERDREYAEIERNKEGKGKPGKKRNKDIDSDEDGSEKIQFSEPSTVSNDSLPENLQNQSSINQNDNISDDSDKSSSKDHPVKNNNFMTTQEVKTTQVKNKGDGNVQLEIESEVKVILQPNNSTKAMKFVKIYPKVYKEMPEDGEKGAEEDNDGETETDEALVFVDEDAPLKPQFNNNSIDLVDQISNLTVDQFNGNRSYTDSSLDSSITPTSLDIKEKTTSLYEIPTSFSKYLNKNFDSDGDIYSYDTEVTDENSDSAITEINSAYVIPNTEKPTAFPFTEVINVEESTPSFFESYADSASADLNVKKEKSKLFFDDPFSTTSKPKVTVRVLDKDPIEKIDEQFAKFGQRIERKKREHDGLSRAKRASGFENIKIDSDFIAKMNHNIGKELKGNYIKYPYYNMPGINSNSPLRYAENVYNIPDKVEGELSFYKRAEQHPCPEIPDNIDPIPDRVKNAHNKKGELEDASEEDDEELEEDGGERKKRENDNGDSKGPRLQLGDRIDCLKARYFGDNPLDSPFFKESIDDVKPIFKELAPKRRNKREIKEDPFEKQSRIVDEYLSKINKVFYKPESDDADDEDEEKNEEDIKLDTNEKDKSDFEPTENKQDKNNVKGESDTKDDQTIKLTTKSEENPTPAPVSLITTPKYTIQLTPKNIYDQITLLDHLPGDNSNTKNTKQTDDKAKLNKDLDQNIIKSNKSPNKENKDDEDVSKKDEKEERREKEESTTEVGIKVKHGKYKSGSIKHNTQNSKVKPHKNRKSKELNEEITENEDDDYHYKDNKQFKPNNEERNTKKHTRNKNNNAGYENNEEENETPPISLKLNSTKPDEYNTENVRKVNDDDDDIKEKEDIPRSLKLKGTKARSKKTIVYDEERVKPENEDVDNEHKKTPLSLKLKAAKPKIKETRYLIKSKNSDDSNTETKEDNSQLKDEPEENKTKKEKSLEVEKSDIDEENENDDVSEPQALRRRRPGYQIFDVSKYLTTTPYSVENPAHVTVLPKYKVLSEVFYKDEIKPNEQLNVFADVLNNIKQESKVIENSLPIQSPSDFAEPDAVTVASLDQVPVAPTVVKPSYTSPGRKISRYSTINRVKKYQSDSSNPKNTVEVNTITPQIATSRPYNSKFPESYVEKHHRTYNVINKNIMADPTNFVKTTTTEPSSTTSKLRKFYKRRRRPANNRTTTSTTVKSTTPLEILSTPAQNHKNYVIDSIEDKQDVGLVPPRKYDYRTILRNTQNIETDNLPEQGIYEYRTIVPNTITESISHRSPAPVTELAEDLPAVYPMVTSSPTSPRVTFKPPQGHINSPQVVYQEAGEESPQVMNTYYFLGMKPPPMQRVRPYHNFMMNKNAVRRRVSNPGRLRLRREASRPSYAEFSRSRGKPKEDITADTNSDDDDDYVPHRPKNWYYDENTKKIVYLNKPKQDEEDEEEEEEEEEIEVEVAPGKYLERAEDATHPTPEKVTTKPLLATATPPPDGKGLLDFVVKLKNNPTYKYIPDPTTPKPGSDIPDSSTAASNVVVDPKSTNPPEFLNILARVRNSNTYKKIEDPKEIKSVKSETKKVVKDEEVEDEDEEVEDEEDFEDPYAHIFDISDFLPTPSGPRVTIDYSKYKTIERHPTRQSQTTRYNSEDKTEDGDDADKEETVRRPASSEKEESEEYPVEIKSKYKVRQEDGNDKVVESSRFRKTTTSTEAPTTTTTRVTTTSQRIVQFRRGTRPSTQATQAVETITVTPEVTRRAQLNRKRRPQRPTTIAQTKATTESSAATQEVERVYPQNYDSPKRVYRRRPVRIRHTTEKQQEDDDGAAKIVRRSVNEDEGYFSNNFRVEYDPEEEYKENLGKLTVRNTNKETIGEENDTKNKTDVEVIKEYDKTKPHGGNYKPENDDENTDFNGEKSDEVENDKDGYKARALKHFSDKQEIKRGDEKHNDRRNNNDEVIETLLSDNYAKVNGFKGTKSPETEKNTSDDVEIINENYDKNKKHGGNYKSIVTRLKPVKDRYNHHNKNKKTSTSENNTPNGSQKIYSTKNNIEKIAGGKILLRPLSTTVNPRSVSRLTDVVRKPEHFYSDPRLPKEVNKLGLDQREATLDEEELEKVTEEGDDYGYEEEEIGVKKIENIDPSSNRRNFDSKENVSSTKKPLFEKDPSKRLYYYVPI